MNLPIQTIMPGALQTAYERELRSLQELEIIPRFWARDISLWPAGPSSKALRKEILEWLDLPEKLEGYISRVVKATNALKDEFDSLVFVAMGSANFTAELLFPMIQASWGKRFVVLDSVNPADIRTLEESVDVRRSIILIVSKTGKILEAHALLLYFLEQLRLAGLPSPGHHLIAVTEEDSYLRALAGEYKFRYLFVDPEGFPGRYSGLIHFSLLLTAFCGSDPAKLLSSIRAMREACGPGRAGSANAAGELAALLAAGAEEGYERLAILTPETMMPLAYRLGQLVGASTCKGGVGVVPLFGFTRNAAGQLQKKWVTAYLHGFGGAQQESEEIRKQAADTGIPLVTTRLERIEDLTAEVFRWEIATCLACALLEVNPFSEPDAENAKRYAVDKLDEISSRRETTEAKPRIVQGEIELYVEGRMRHEISMLSQADALRSFFQLAPVGGYLAILSFLPRAQGTWELLRRLQESLQAVLPVPVLLNHGPRYLQTAGQCYKGGPPKGIFLMLTEKSSRDINVPGAGYTFGELGTAMALGDFQSLGERARPVVRLHLRKGSAEGSQELQGLVEQALVGIRRAKR